MLLLAYFFSPLHSKQLDGESEPLLEQHQQVVPLQDSYMQGRAEALHNVESTIHELGNIFTQLATMVSQQGELAIRSTIVPLLLIFYPQVVVSPTH